MNFDKELMTALTKHPLQRGIPDIQTIYSFLRRLDSFSRLGDQPLKVICRSARYEYHRANEILFRKHQLSTCWFILLSGSVFIGGNMYLPRDNFGKRTSTSNRRANDCIVLEPSEMIVIDYPDVQSVPIKSSSVVIPSTSTASHPIKHPYAPPVPNGTLTDHLRRRGVTSMNLENIVLPPPPLPSCQRRPSPAEARRRRHVLPATPPAAYDSRCAASPLRRNSTTSASGVSIATTTGGYSASSRTTVSVDDDLADLPEANVDSDEEDDESCPSGDSLLELRDNVRECLEKEPSERTDEDVSVLLDFMQHMPAFANLPLRVRHRLCLKMVFAIVETAGTTVMRDQEQLDSWCVLVNGEVEVQMPDGSKVEFHLGDSFGVEPRLDAQHQQGQMRTLVDDCQFVLVAQRDYVDIMSKASDNLRKHTDAAGEIVVETERRTLENNREGYVLIKGKPEKLVQALVEDRDTTVDQYYVEDFLLMYRTFIDNPTEVFQKFLQWFNNDAHLREKVARLVLLWVNNHFNDFESDSQMTVMLEDFERCLEREHMINHQQLLNIACSVKSKSRVVIYKRSNREEILHFSILGGNMYTGPADLTPPVNYGIFVSKVEKNSQAEKIGLKRGDQILEVNNTSFLSISYQKALEILRNGTHLSITVKSNLLGFKEMLSGDTNELQHTAKLSCPPKNLSIETTSTGHVLPRNKFGTPGLSPSCSRRIMKAGQVPAVLHHTQSYIDAKQFPNFASAPIRSSVPSSPVAKPNGETKEISRLGKLIKKLKHGTSSSSLPLDEDRVDSAGRCPVNFDPAPAAAQCSYYNPTAATKNAPSPATGAYYNPTMTLDETGGVSRLKHSRSNPDLSNPNNSTAGQNQLSKYCQPSKPPCPELVLKVYRADQAFKYLPVNKDTTAQCVVYLALVEFGLISGGANVEEFTNGSSFKGAENWSLCEVIVSSEGFIKQRRLPDQMQNLAERISLNSRYYLKNNQSTDPLVSDSLAPDLLKESQTSLVDLNANVLAAQLTLQDFSMFASVEPTEYVDSLFRHDASKYGWPRLQQFEQVVNKEMWWVASEVCRERQLVRRAKLVKKFIKIARQCRDFKNFNSMFAIVSGLEKPCVRRLHSTWDKVPGKYLKAFDDLRQLLDPSRNMSKYRQHLGQVSVEPPVIPLMPVVRKDLYFIHECNATFFDGLVNFEKLRMIAKEIRTVTKLASAPFELSSMYEQSGGFGSSRINDALLSMNSFEGGAAIATMRKQFLQKGFISRKKLYEQALMVRRVKSYLASLNVVDDENELDRMSTECEPMQSAAGTSSSNLGRRRQPSPSPSSMSGASQLSSDINKRMMQPKFGVESPHAVQRMLALVDHSRLKASGNASSALFQHTRSVSPSSGGGSHGSGAATSPSVFRRKPGSAVPLGGATGHGRSQSESNRENMLCATAGATGQQRAVSTCGPPPPVDLNAESSCVNILAAPFRMHSSGSVTSTDSALSQHSASTLCRDLAIIATSTGGAPPSAMYPSQRTCPSCTAPMAHAVSCDSTDSGHCSIDASSSGASGLARHRSSNNGAVAVTMTSCCACGSAGAMPGNSPPNQRRSYPMNQQQRLCNTKAVPSGAMTSCASSFGHHIANQQQRRFVVNNNNTIGNGVGGRCSPCAEYETGLDSGSELGRRTNSIPSETANPSSVSTNIQQTTRAPSFENEQISRV